MGKKRGKWIVAMALLMAMCVSAPAVLAQTTAKDPQEQVRQNWDELMHYTLIGRLDLAKEFGEALVASSPDPVYLLSLAESDRYTDSYRNLNILQKNADLAEMAGKILKLLEDGRFQQRTDFQRIAIDVTRLSDTTRARMNALKRLQDSGEWAIPVMIQALRDAGRSDEFANIKWALPQIGKAAVNPLVVVLQQCGELEIKLIVLDALGKIGYPASLPYIREVVEDKESSPELKAAALSAIGRILGAENASTVSASILYERLARDYYQNLSSLQVPENQDYANVWFWKDQGGLYFEQVPSGAFAELMTMRCCELSLKLDPALGTTISLWLSAFFRLEAEGFKQPEYFGTGHADADTYALTAGPEYLHRVLSLALENRNRPVALHAIQALQRNSGQKSLLLELESQQPLLKALNYPDREVRFSAALTLGKANPQANFNHSELVVPIIAEALLQKGKKYAVVVDENQDRRNGLAASLGGTGFFAEVVNGENFAVMLEQASGLASFDLIVLSENIQNPNLSEAMETIRKNYHLAFTPTIVLSESRNLTLLRKSLEADSFVEVVLDNTPAEELAALVPTILSRNQSQSFSGELADTYAQAAADILLNLATVRNPVLDVMKAEPALLAAISDERKPIQETATKTLAHMDSLESQRAIARLSLDEKVEIPVRLMAFRALATSAKMFGNLLLTEQVGAIYSIVNSLEANVELRNLAAEAYGSLNLPSVTISQLILNQARSGSR
jgi:CheY-like chemotaxis protein/HEAT repeat protein